MARIFALVLAAVLSTAAVPALAANEAQSTATAPTPAPAPSSYLPTPAPEPQTPNWRLGWSLFFDGDPPF